MPVEANRKPKSLILPAFVAGVSIILTGVVHGVWTNRWSTVDPTMVSAKAIAELPMTIGDWVATDLELDDASLQLAGITGYVYRRYVDQRTGNAVTAVLMCGRPGPISVHPPTACYRGAGYESIGSPLQHVVEAPAVRASQSRVTDGLGRPSSNKSANSRGADRVPARSDVFRVADFQKPGPLVGETVRIFWSLSNDGTWTTPDNPRVAFAGSPALYKLYVTHHTTSTADPIDESYADEFLRKLLASVRKHVFHASGPPQHPAPAAATPAHTP